MTVLKHPGSPIPSVSGQSGNLLSTNGSELVWSPPAVTGMILLSTTTLATTSTVITNISQSYKSLFIRIYGITSTPNNDNMYIDMNNTNNIAYTYNIQGAASSTSQNFIRTYTPFDRTNSGNAFDLFIDRYTSTGLKPFHFYGTWMNNSSARTSMQAAGADWQTSAITSIRVTMNGQTMSTGTIEIYGVN